RGAGRVIAEGGREDDPLVVLDEVAAGRPAEAVADLPTLGAVDPHDELLVASLVDGALALEGQPLTIIGEVRLGVVAAEGELADVAQPPLARLGRMEDGGGGGRGLRDDHRRGGRGGRRLHRGSGTRTTGGDQDRGEDERCSANGEPRGRW